MTQADAFRLIRTLRETIADVPDPTADGGWVNDVIEHLDRATDVIEFPKKAASTTG